jgi:hypothetical protein
VAEGISGLGNADVRVTGSVTPAQIASLPTTGQIDLSAVTTITASVNELQALLADLPADLAVTLTDASADAAALNALDAVFGPRIDGSSIATLTGTQEAADAAQASDGLLIPNAVFGTGGGTTPGTGGGTTPITGGGGGGGGGGSEAAATTPVAPPSTPVAPTPEETGSSNSGAKTEFTGSNPADPIIGDNSDNRLVPLVAGSFRMEGKLGADDFVFDVAQKFSRNTADVVVDFNSAEGDEFVLGSEAFEGLTKVKFKTVDSKKGLKKALASKKTIVYYQDKGQLLYNANGKEKGAGADGGQFATVENLADLSGSDFTLL